jgi:two-component system LytT family response regulator
MIKAVIIEDNPEISALNGMLLNEFFGDKIELAGVADSVSGGVKLIENTHPDLVLSDIEIKEGSSFEMLEKLRPYNFKLIFITAFNAYALKAIKFSAIDYIVKPIDEEEFKMAVERVISLIEAHTNTHLQDEYLLNSFKRETQLKKIVLRTADALHLVDLADVMYCKSDNSYTTFFLESGEAVIVSKSLGDYADLLGEYGFFRPHQSYLVNLNYVKKVDRGDGGFIVMRNNDQVPLSSRQKKNLLNILEKL